MSERYAAVDRPDSTALLAAVLAAAAGLLHLAVVRPHLQEGVFQGLLLLGAAWAGLAVAALLVTRPTTRTRVAAALVMLSIASAYALSRTVGLPFPPYDGQVEDARVLGLVATVAAVVAAVVVLAGLAWRPAFDPRHPGLVGGAAAVSLAGLVSAALLLTPPGHGHGGGEHGSGGAAAEQAGHSEGGHSEPTSAAGPARSATTGTGPTRGVSPSAGSGSASAESGSTGQSEGSGAEDGHTHAPGERH